MIPNRIAAVFLAMILTVGMLPVAFAGSTDAITVKIIGGNGILLNTSLNIETVTDYTTDSNDENTSPNALDAVISATLQNSYDAASYSISYDSSYGTYYLSKIANTVPDGYDYWGTLAVDASGGCDGSALSSHTLTAGDTYIVYYDKYTGAGTNYGYQSYAYYTADTCSGTTGSAVSVAVKTAGYDSNYNTVLQGLANATIYAVGPDYASPTAVAVTDSNGNAYITFADAGDYTLSLSSDYTFTQCAVSVTGSSVSLSDLHITVTDGETPLTEATLTLTDNSGTTCSACSIQSGVFAYRLVDGIYTYCASAGGYQTANGTVAVSGETSKSIPLTAMSGHTVTITHGDAANETVSVQNSSGAVQTAVSAQDGVHTYDLVDGSYTHTVSRTGYHSAFGSFTVNGADLQLTVDALTEAASGGAEWPSFRGTADNMAIVTNATAKGVWQSQEKWTVSLGSLNSYGTLSSSNLVIYDDYLYVATEHGLSKINKNTGTLLKTAALSTDSSYVTQIAYGSGKIFVTNASGLDAFDALTMERVWTAEISPYGDYMATTPILYDDTTKTVYVGDYGDSNYTLGTYGGYSAIDAETGTGKWILYGGATDAHYWSGAFIDGNYIVFGSDSNTVSSVRTVASGSVSAADTLSVTGKVRSSIAGDGSFLYFTTSSGYIYKATLDNSTGELAVSGVRQFTTAGSGSTPVVCGGRIYVGANDGIYVLNADDLSQVSYQKTGGSVLSSALVTTQYVGTDNAVYAYFADNSAQGDVVVVADDGTNVSYRTLYIPSHAQYCLSSLVSDSEGVIYYVNDSGYLSAVSNTGESNANHAEVVFAVTPSSVFDASTYATAFPSITVKDNDGAEVSTAAEGSYSLPAGNYTYTVRLAGYTTANGSFAVIADDISNGSKTIPVNLSASSPVQDTNITVTLKVTGYNKQSLIPETSVTVPEKSSAWTALKKALSDAGIPYVANTTSYGVYIASVSGLAEFDHGSNSGWKYSVNGENPSVSVNKCTLSSGDDICLYYTSDYTTDSGSSSVAGSAGADVTLSATLNRTTGVASSTLSGDSLTAFNKAVKADGDTVGSEAVIGISLPSGTNAVNFTLPQSSVSALCDTSGTSLRITSAVGSLTFDPAAIDSIGNSAGGKDIVISIAKADNASLRDTEKALVGNHPVYDLSISASGNHITDFGGGTVKVSIPYTPEEGEVSENLTVYYIDTAGKVTEMTGAVYDAETGCIVFATRHFSRFAVVYDVLKSFADVSSSDWFADAVRYVSENTLMNGTGKNSFDPNADMTRAMLLTVLYRLDGKQSVAGTSRFTDVAAGQWYSDAVIWASENGLVSGYGNGKFGINDSITREQIATVLYHYAQYKGYDVTKSADLTVYTDAGTLSSWSSSAMRWANAADLIHGNAPTELAPNENATRAQVATILMRFQEGFVE